MKKKTKKLSREIEEKDINLARTLVVGDTVKIKGTETLGILIEIKDDTAIVLSGSIKVRSKLNKLEYSSQKEVNRPSRNLYDVATRIDSLRLDIRGKKPEEAEFEVIKYIDDAYRNDLKTVEILHGKGTGVLRKLVFELLDKHEAVKNHYTAKIEFGGEGITIVELK